jgi:hypothetical protein
MLRLILATIVASGYATQVHAQRNPTEQNFHGTLVQGASEVTSPCTYDKCALRFTLGFGKWRLLQGANDKKIGDLGYFTGPNVEQLVSDVPDAAEAARLFRSSYRTSSALVWGGALLTLVAGGAATANDGNPVALAVGTGGLATVFYGAWRHGKSFDLLSRSIWLYNRSLRP